MLKLTYTESGFYIERLAQSPEQLVALRVMLAMRVGQKIVVEPSSAAFLLPVSLPDLSMLEVAVQKEGGEDIALCVADDEFVEVSLGGIWITVDPEQENGIFIATLSDRIELLLFKLWQATEANASVSQETSDW
ncbi:alr0857 family protein [Dapis sp. BLCC M126]|uniref:alr0857 family protein n=1 Tax=Dapis sp. BLCC M126 TaxID=3400189 RepID=UPI003CF2F9A4